MIFWAVAALQAVALILAAWRRPIPRILLALIAYSLADELLVEALHAALDGAPRPFTGLHIAGYHASVGIVVGWPALLASAAWRVFAGPQKADGPVLPEPSSSLRPTLTQMNGADAVSSQRAGRNTMRTVRCAVEAIFGVWLGAALGLAAVYPLPRGMTAPMLHALQLAFVVAALAAIPGGWRRRTITTQEGAAVGLLVVVELVVGLCGAWATGAGVFTEWDRLARLPYCIGWGALVVLQLRWARCTPRS